MENIACDEKDNEVENDSIKSKSSEVDNEICDKNITAEMAVNNDINSNKSMNESVTDIDNNESISIDNSSKTLITTEVEKEPQITELTDIEVMKLQDSTVVDPKSKLNDNENENKVEKNTSATDLEESDNFIEEYLDEEYLEYETAEGEPMTSYEDSDLRAIIPSDSDDDGSDTSPVMAYLEKTENLSFYKNCDESLTAKMAATTQATPLRKHIEIANVSNGYFTPNAFEDDCLVHPRLKSSSVLKSASRVRGAIKEEDKSSKQDLIEQGLSEVSRKDDSCLKRSRKQRLEPANVEIVFEVGKVEPTIPVSGKVKKRLGRSRKTDKKLKIKWNHRQINKNILDTPQRQSKRLSNKVIKKKVCKIASCKCDLEHDNTDSINKEVVSEEESTQEIEEPSDYSDEWQLPTKPLIVTSHSPKIKVYSNIRKRQLSHKSTYDEDDELSNDLIDLIREDEKSDKEIDLSKIFPEDLAGVTPTKRTKIDNSDNKNLNIKLSKSKLKLDYESDDKEKPSKHSTSDIILSETNKNLTCNNNFRLLDNILVTDTIDVENFEGFESNQEAVLKLKSPLKSKPSQSGFLSNYFNKDEIKVNLNNSNDYKCNTCNKQFKTKTRLRLHQQIHKSELRRKSNRFSIQLNKVSTSKGRIRRTLVKSNLKSKHTPVIKKSSKMSDNKISTKIISRDKIGVSQKMNVHECKSCNKGFINNILLRKHESICNENKTSKKITSPKNKVKSFINQLDSLEDKIVSNKSNSPINKGNKKILESLKKTDKENISAPNRTIASSRLRRLPENTSQKKSTLIETCVRDKSIKNLKVVNKMEDSKKIDLKNDIQKSPKTKSKAQPKAKEISENCLGKADLVTTKSISQNDFELEKVAISQEEIRKNDDSKKVINPKNESVSPKGSKNVTNIDKGKSDNINKTKMSTRNNIPNRIANDSDQDKRRNSRFKSDSVKDDISRIAITKNTISANKPKHPKCPESTAVSRQTLTTRSSNINRTSIYRSPMLRRTGSLRKVPSSNATIRSKISIAQPSSLKRSRVPAPTKSTIKVSSTKTSSSRILNQTLKNDGEERNLNKSDAQLSGVSGTQSSKKKSARKPFKMPAEHSGVPLSSKMRKAFEKLRADMAKIKN